MRRTGLLRTALVGVLAAAGAAVAVATPAQAAPSLGCVYPRVCFYKTSADMYASSPTAAYQDVTSSWQTLGTRSKDSYAVYNSRNDDGALLQFANGSTRCVLPGQGLYDMPNQWGYVRKIRIMTSPTC